MASGVAGVPSAGWPGSAAGGGGVPGAGSGAASAGVAAAPGPGKGWSAAAGGWAWEGSAGDAASISCNVLRWPSSAAWRLATWRDSSARRRSAAASSDSRCARLAAGGGVPGAQALVSSAIAQQPRRKYDRSMAYPLDRIGPVQDALQRAGTAAFSGVCGPARPPESGWPRISKSKCPRRYRPAERTQNRE